METPSQYTLQLRFVENGSEGKTALEVMALPVQTGIPHQGRFPQWESLLETICRSMGSSAFHRKAIQRTLQAGLPAHMIDRSTGSKYVFTAEEIAQLCLTPQQAEDLLRADLTAA